MFRFKSSLFYFIFNMHTTPTIVYSGVPAEALVLNKYTLCFKGQENFSGMLKGGALGCYPLKRPYTCSHSPVAAKIIIKSLK